MNRQNVSDRVGVTLSNLRGGVHERSKATRHRHMRIFEVMSATDYGRMPFKQKSGGLWLCFAIRGYR